MLDHNMVDVPHNLNATTTFIVHILLHHIQSTSQFTAQCADTLLISCLLEVQRFVITVCY